MSNSIYKEYFNLSKQYISQYGEKTVVLMQVGSFFEIYALKNDTLFTSINDICNICQFSIAEKKAIYEDKQVLMAGFPEYKLEKYLQKITEENYSAVVYVQEKNEKNTKRILHSIHSPGTYIPFELDSSPQITNYIMCIWFETFKPVRSFSPLNKSFSKMSDNIIYGISVANMYTGHSSIFEYQTPFLMNPTTFDELERYISMFSPSEMIVISPFDKMQITTILQYIGVQNTVVHFVDSNLTSQNEKVKNCTKQTYIQHILSSFYGEETFQVCSEFSTNMVATQSFCYLLNFIKEHNPDLVKKIAIPIFNNSSDRMILANHTLKQLNIIDDHSNDGKRCGGLSSVLTFLNKCCTPIGKRMFQYQLLNPTFNETWLNYEYNVTDFMREQYPIIQNFRSLLLGVKDIEKMSRQIVLKKIYPSSIYNLYKTIEIIQQLNMCLYEQPVITEYLCEKFVKEKHFQYMETTTRTILNYLHSHLIIEKCRAINNMQQMETNIIQRGISSALDSYIDQEETAYNTFQAIREHLNTLMNTHENSQDVEYVKEHKTEKSGISLQITKKRATLLKKILLSITNSKEPFLKINATTSVSVKDIKISSASTSTDEIECPLLSRLSKDLLVLKDKINTEICNVYQNIITTFENTLLTSLEHLILYIGKLDVLQCKVYISKEYNYCKPIIVNEDIHEGENENKSFVDAVELRHCLIEHIQQNEIYVPNSLSLGNKDKGIDGILLFGTNAVGKTSMIRALGIAVIMAQCGLYVPCSRFHYKPYTSIYSRILGNDNIFKGLSTFAVEMSELRIILKTANANSLILGDELCSGTETESALSIFVSGLMDLYEKNASFIFATHFHEIVNYDEIKALEKMKMMHLAVLYDREKDCLIYDRKLKEGSGTRMYGLEVCKSLYLPDEFLERAYSIRNKYFPDSAGELSNKTTVYNSKKILSTCEKCKVNMGEEIHHLQEQRNANEDGFIGGFHKNHVANLMSICQKCHDEIHSTKKTTLSNSNQVNVSSVKPKTVRKKTTTGYSIFNYLPNQSSPCGI
jgi:DNA mismatch repair protein MutS